MFIRFATGQAGIQLINVGTGLYLLRALNVLQYAQYSTAFAFQSTMTLLVDLGFSGSIIALVGDRGHEPVTVGNYVRAARHYRIRSFIILGIASAIAFPLLMVHQQWGFEVKLALWAAVISSVFFQGSVMFSAPLLIHRQLRPFYTAQLIPSGLRLILMFALRAGHQLNGWISAWIGSVAIAIQGFLYKRYAAAFFEEPEAPDREVLREMRNYVAPLWPALIYYAFQGQITVALISYFGKSHNIAEVAALGRLGQLFAFFGAMNSVLVEPYIAQVHSSLLLKRYLLISTLAVAFGMCITLFSYFFPGIFLLLLGPNYQHLRGFIWLTVLGSSASYVSGVLIVMNGARKWVYWRTTLLSTGFVFVTQLIAVTRLDLSKTRSMVVFGMTMPFAALFSVALVAVYGYLRTTRESKTPYAEELA